MTNLMGRLAMGCLFLTAVSARAGTILVNVDFGTGSGVSGFSWPSTSNASGSTTGVALAGPIKLDGGAIVITGNGTVECAVGVTANTCGTSTGLSNLTAYGLGVGNARIDVGDTLTLTVQSGFGVTNVELVSFSLTGFTNDGAGGSPEVAAFSLDGGAANLFTATGPSTATPKTDNPSGANFVNTLRFGSNAGNYSLASLQLQVTTTPEPATMGIVGLALVGCGLLGRRSRRA